MTAGSNDDRHASETDGVDCRGDPSVELQGHFYDGDLDLTSESQVATRESSVPTHWISQSRM